MSDVPAIIDISFPSRQEADHASIIVTNILLAQKKGDNIAIHQEDDLTVLRIAFSKYEEAEKIFALIETAYLSAGNHVASLHPQLARNDNIVNTPPPHVRPI